MSDKKTVFLAGPEQRRYAKQLIDQAPKDYACTIQEKTRTLEQNAAQWPILEAFARQRRWPVNGQMVWMSDEEWKDVLTAAFKEETIRLAAGLRGGVVMLGQRTSKFGKKQFSEWLEFLHASASEMGVNIEQEKPFEE